MQENKEEMNSGRRNYVWRRGRNEGSREERLKKSEKR